MPFIRFSTNKKLSTAQNMALKQESGQLIELLPEKTERALMLHIEDDQVMYYQGNDDETMYIDMRLFGHASRKDKEKFAKSLMESVEKITGIPSDHQYLTISEYDQWGMQGGFIHK
jgi:hypothetical protein